VPIILKVDPTESSDDAELDFEIAYQASLTTAQRFEIMFARSRLIAEQLLRHGHRKAAEVVKRA